MTHIARLDLTQFRNYARMRIEVDARPVVLTGPNGAGKTNLLEAISWLAPGRGLRGVALAEATRHDSEQSWAVAAVIATPGADIRAGTGPRPGRTSRVVQIDGQPRAPAALSATAAILWQTPAMDGLFTGPAEARRSWFDRIVAALLPGHAAQLAAFTRTMRQRNRRLENGMGAPDTLADALERQMAAHGVTIAAARREAAALLTPHLPRSTAFPQAVLSLSGQLEDALREQAAIDVEDDYIQVLHDARPRDAAARRTLEGPHRSDILITHRQVGQPARFGSTGEQKAMLTGLTLAQLAAVRQQRATSPILLLDEVVAHLDERRREALLVAIAQGNAQVWMTGTDFTAFGPLQGFAQCFTVAEAAIIPR